MALAREEVLEIIVGQLECGRAATTPCCIAELQVRVLVEELEQALESEGSQAVARIIRLVAHVDVDRVVEHRLEELAALDAGDEALESARIPALVDGVSVEAARLAGQHLSGWEAAFAQVRRDDGGRARRR